jgi:hypothetical protein
MVLHHAHLLCYGHDEMLLYTRQQILNKKFSVDTCVDFAGLSDVLSRGPLDGALICHSVPNRECGEVIGRLHILSPKTKVLAIEEYMPRICATYSDAVMNNMEGPHALLRKTHALLGMASEGDVRKNALN